MRVATLTELASGVDALYLSGRAAPPASLLERLESARTEAVALDARPPFQFGALEMRIAPHSFGKYRYCLDHPYGRIGLTPSSKLPALRIQPRAEFLHGIGAEATVDAFRDLIEAEVGPVRLSVSRLDLFADFQGWALSGDDRGHFLCRARDTATYEADEDLRGLQFGKRSSGTVSARLYDKTEEMTSSGSNYWLDIWGERCDRDRPVLRVEFELGRVALREFGLDTPEDVLAATGSLWTYLTSKWLTYRTPTIDATKSRWPLAPEWESVTRASVADSSHGIERMYAGKRRGQLINLMPGLVGYLASFGALTDSPDFARMIPVLAEFLNRYARDSGKTLDWRIFLKQQALGA